MIGYSGMADHMSSEHLIGCVGMRSLARLPDITVSRLPELLPWNWKVEQEAVKAA